MKNEIELVATGSQTVGPFFHLGCTDVFSIPVIADSLVDGEHIKLICTLQDGEGMFVPDAMIEVWQANADGKYNHPEDTQDKQIDPEFRGFGRLASDANGTCRFETIMPGRVPSWTDVPQAPHFVISVFARGILKRLATRAYFMNEPANAGRPRLGFSSSGPSRDTDGTFRSRRTSCVAVRYPTFG